MSEKYYDSDTSDNSQDVIDSNDKTSEISDVGKQSMRGGMDYSHGTNIAIAEINNLPQGKRQDAVGELKEKNRPAWDELGRGGIDANGVFAPNGDYLIRYKEAKDGESE